MALMIVGMILATVGLGLTALATLKLTGDLPDPIASALRYDGTHQAQRAKPREPSPAGSAALVAGVLVQLTGAVVATISMTEAEVTMAIAVSWILAGSGLLLLRSP